LREIGQFEQFEVEFLEYEGDTQMGDVELLKMCKAYRKSPRERPTVFIFDRDNPSVLKQIVGRGKEYKSWGNNVYSFALPVPRHRQTIPEVSIEFYYKDEEIKRKDLQGRRLFLSSEFHPRSGWHHTEDLHCMDLNKVCRATVTIVDDKVFNRESENVALSKNDFADYILNRVVPFDNFGVSEFARVFDVIAEILTLPRSNLVALADQQEDELTSPHFAPDPDDIYRVTTQSWCLPLWGGILDRDQKQVRWDVDEFHNTVLNIEQTLELLGVPARIREVTCGRVFTQYILEPECTGAPSVHRVKAIVQEIIGLSDDLTTALALKHPIEIAFPLQGKHRRCFGLVTRSPEKTTICLGSLVLESKDFRVSSQTTVALGESVEGCSVLLDLASTPHLLIVGRVNSGKSVCVGDILACLLLRNTPALMRLILVDSKGVEFAHYEGIPHLLDSVVEKQETFLDMLKWIKSEIQNRYQQFSEIQVRDINGFNAMMHGRGVMPRIFVVIQELFDIVNPVSNDIIRSIAQLARISHLFGIHIIFVMRHLASRLVGELTHLCPLTKISFALASRDDSVAVLGVGGAEKLSGCGDMLLLRPSMSVPLHVQGSFVTDEEIRRITAYWKNAVRTKTPPC
jgi:hypothetical protein